MISGSVAREDDKLRFFLVGSNLPQRRFSAARSTFLAWSNSQKLLVLLLWPVREISRPVGESVEVTTRVAVRNGKAGKLPRPTQTSKITRPRPALSQSDLSAAPSRP